MLVDLAADAAALGIELTTEQIEKLRALVSLLQEWNERISLTAIRSTDEIVAKHILDSLAVAAYSWRVVSGQEPRTVMDVGSGAGFPALPLAVAFPSVRVTALESVRKKAEFIGLAAATLGVDLRVINERAEVAAHLSAHRNHYDLVLARAVAYLPALAEYCLPFARVGGYFVAMKSEAVEEEIADGIYAVEQLGGRMLEPVSYELLGVAGRRWLIVVEKVARTAEEYPRAIGIPTRRPLHGG